MIIFFTIAAGAFLYILLTSMFGHDHDMDHDIGGMDHDIDHSFEDGDEAGDENGHMMSIFNTKVIAMFVMGFGATGGIAMYYNKGYPLSCVLGMAAGAAMGVATFYLLEFLSRQQANSLVKTSSLIGRFGTVEVKISGIQPGQVGVSADDRYGTYVARGKAGAVIERGSKVKIVDTVGSDLIVEQV